MFPPFFGSLFFFSVSKFLFLLMSLDSLAYSMRKMMADKALVCIFLYIFSCILNYWE